MDDAHMSDKTNEKKFDLHVHTRFSDGMDSPKDVIVSAMKKGLAGMAIADHDSIEGYAFGNRIMGKLMEDKGFLLIPAVEVSTPQGDVLALGVEQKFRGTALEVLDKIHKAGGIAVICHPFYWYIDFEKHLSSYKKFDAVEVLNSYVHKPGNMMAMNLAEKLGLPGFAGSDAHLQKDVGNCHIILKPSHEQDMNIEYVLNCIKNGELSLGAESNDDKLLASRWNKSRGFS